MVVEEKLARSDQLNFAKKQHLVRNKWTLIKRVKMWRKASTYIFISLQSFYQINIYQIKIKKN